MDEENAFLRKLLEQPSNDLTRLVYADWLDERGTPEAIAKAEFLRLIADAELVGKFNGRAKTLARNLPLDWLAVVSKLPVENCPLPRRALALPPASVQFEYECPKKWEDLTTTERSNERFCSGCQKTIHYCSTIREARLHTLDNHCIAVDLAIPRQPDDLRPPPPTRLVVGYARFPNPARLRSAIHRAPVDPVSEARERAMNEDGSRAQRGKRRKGRRKRHWAEEEG